MNNRSARDQVLENYDLTKEIAKGLEPNDRFSLAGVNRVFKKNISAFWVEVEKAQTAQARVRNQAMCENVKGCPRPKR